MYLMHVFFFAFKDTNGFWKSDLKSLLITFAIPKIDIRIFRNSDKAPKY